MSKKDKKSANASVTNQHEIIRRLNDLQPSKRKSAKRRPKDEDLGWISDMEVVLTTEDERTSFEI